MLESFFNKVAGLQVCEICKIFKNTFFTEHLWWLFLELQL